MDRPVYFFTSCTRGDGWTSITRFHADLEYRLRVQDGSWVNGALSESAPDTPGQDWRHAAREGIARAGCMIVLASQEYFLSKWCGLEWAAFRSRVTHHKAVNSVDAAQCLIPLVWKPVPPRELPATVADTPFETPDLGADYAERGLLSLMRSGDPADEDAYFLLLGHLAHRVIEARGLALPPLDAGDFEQLTPAFGTHPDLPDPDRGDRGRAGDGGPRPVRMTARPIASVTRVAISYVGPDQAWADWINDILEAAGHPVRQMRWETGHQSLVQTVTGARGGSDRVVVVFSRRYFASGDTEPTDWESAFTDTDADEPWLVPVQIDHEPRPLLIRQTPVLQLSGSDAGDSERLRAAVLTPPTGGPLPRGER